MASTYVKYLKEAIATAAQWKHVIFVVLPMPFASSDVGRFESFMQEFNVDPPKLNNVVSSVSKTGSESLGVAGLRNSF